MTAFENNAERVECYVCGGDGRCSDVSGGVVWRCVRCKGKGTVLVDKPCSECGGDGWLINYRNNFGSECSACTGTGVEPRDKRMERLMREADQYIRLSTSATERIAFLDGFGAYQTKNVTAPWHEIELKMACLTGWSYQDWQMRKDGYDG